MCFSIAWRLFYWSPMIYILSPIINIEQGYRNSQRPSLCLSVHPLTAKIFHKSSPNFHSMFILMKKLFICRLFKSGEKLLLWQLIFFFFSFTWKAYMKAWWKIIIPFHNIFIIKLQHHCCWTFCKLCKIVALAAF